MLAQNFKTAEELGIKQDEYDALVTVLGMLERNELTHVPHGTPNIGSHGPFTGHFNMADWNTIAECGTIACIGGTAEMMMGRRFGDMPQALDRLFYPKHIQLSTITIEEAARATRSYLTTGRADWDKAQYE